MAPAVRAYLEKFRGRLPDAAYFAIAGSSGCDRTMAEMEKLSGKKALAFWINNCRRENRMPKN